MRKVAIIVFSFLWYQQTIAQVPVSFYLSESDQYSACNFSRDHIYFLANGKVIKTDYQGNILWTKTNLPLPAIIQDSICFSIRGNGTNWDVVKNDTAGNNIWVKDISATVCPQYNGDYNRPSGMVVKGDRIYISSAQYNLTYGFDGLSALLTLDTSGNAIASWCDPTVPVITNYITKGYNSFNGAGWFVFRHGGVGLEESIVKMNIDGTVDTLTSTVEVDMGLTVSIREIMPMMDSTYTAVCQIYGNNGFGEDYIGLSRFRDDGSVIWQELIRLQLDTSLFVNGATCDSLGNIYLIGTMISNSFHSIVTIKIDNNGTVLFAKEWIDPELYSSLEFGKLYFKDGVLCCFLKIHDGAQFHPGVLVFDTMFSTCNVPQNIFTIPSILDPIWNSVWHSYPPINYTTTSNTINITSAIDPFSNDLCLVLHENEFSSVAHLTISPNPFQNKIKVRSESRPGLNLEILNLLGCLVFTDRFSDGQAEINLSNLPAGIYTARVTAGSFVHSQKIVKVE